ncbi:MAG TPA: hypothetical protein PKK31_04335 [Elusimicrobiales bacterium]|nr:hypothetical protein [Elusimicrobiales bacterium]
MKNPSAAISGIFAAAIVATVFLWSAASAAGNVEDLKPAASAGDAVAREAAVPAASAAEKAVRPGRTPFDEFSVIGDPLYRKGSMELLKKAVESGSEEKPAAAKEKTALPAAGEVKAKAVPAKKAAPDARPADLRDAPSDVRKALPAPRMKRPAPRPLPADPVAPRKTS